MSQQRARKAGGAEGRRALGRAAGDGGAAPARPPHAPRPAKIPKSLRYDLENALVGLCDVWFEEIKPHLVRNNIKVHADGAGAGAASGDHQRLPPGAPGCSHLDPALSAGVCQLCRLLFNAANSIESAVSQAASAAPTAQPAAGLASAEIALLPSGKNPCRTCEVKRPRAPPARRARAQPPPAPAPGWRAPRLCRTYSVLSPRVVVPHRRTHTANPHYCSNQSKRKPKKVNKSTQTPVYHQPAFHQPDTSRSARPPDAHRSARAPDTGRSARKEAPDKCPRCPATTTLAHRSRRQAPPLSPLFREDLINIIAENNDKQLKLLFKSPPRDPSNPSTMNLVPTHPFGLRAHNVKRVPWR